MTKLIKPTKDDVLRAALMSQAEGYPVFSASDLAPYLVKLGLNSNDDVYGPQGVRRRPYLAASIKKHLLTLAADGVSIYRDGRRINNDVFGIITTEIRDKLSAEARDLAALDAIAKLTGGERAYGGVFFTLSQSKELMRRLGIEVNP